MKNYGPPLRLEVLRINKRIYVTHDLEEQKDVKIPRLKSLGFFDYRLLLLFPVSTSRGLNII